jgi:two-component system nitrogen regulation response regulator NtrX
MKSGMSLKTQSKILRVIQEQEFERLGGQKYPHRYPHYTATNKNLKKLLAVEKFREDLYYRLSVIPFIYLRCVNAKTIFRYCGLFH